jgi:hypothetical protein
VALAVALDAGTVDEHTCIGLELRAPARQGWRSFF